MNEKLVALVTGASSGIGQAIAERLLEDGFRVYGAARRLERMSALREKGAVTLKLDVTDGSDIANAVAEIQKAHGGVDVLVNNAGFGSFGAVEDTSIEDARYQFEVNLFGAARLTQAVLPDMRARRSGRIVNISSMGGRIYTPLGSWYHATKHAIEGWSDCLRLELAPFGIHVIVIQPGIIETEFGSTLLGPLMLRSGSSAYAEMAKRVESATRRVYGRGAGSPPSLIAATVSRALRARRPATRYAAGKFARPLLFIRKWLGDRVFDRAVMGQV